MRRISRQLIVATTVGVLAAAMAVAPASAVSVSINGANVALFPGPIVRSGRTFVPLRGVFEHLGASVVYDNGQINCTGSNSTVSLNVGSNQATVNGQAQQLDVAPFIVGASTYVPLRFVSEALGANVDWDDANQLVAITTSQAAAPAQPAQPYPRPAAVSGILTRERPSDGANVLGSRPLIAAAFNADVDPNTVRVWLDGQEITDSATRSANGFAYRPQSPLVPERHVVRVAGNLQDGRRFRDGFAFSTSG